MVFLTSLALSEAATWRQKLTLQRSDVPGAPGGEPLQYGWVAGGGGGAIRVESPGCCITFSRSDLDIRNCYTLAAGCMCEY